MAEKEKICSRRRTIVEENRRRLGDMHPKAPKIEEKTLTIKGLITICESPTFIVDDGEELAYLCNRCKEEIGGALEAQGAKIKHL